MSSQKDLVIDEWDLKLDEKLKELKECQRSKAMTSCSKCEQFLDCEQRKKYILAVYESMNKGSSGGFEF